MRVTMLGCGTSSGVPRLGDDWGDCDRRNPRNRRRRVSILVEAGPSRILVDTGPDMREQLLAAGIATIDAVLYTHDHADHTHGIDDLRGLMQNAGARVRCHANEATWAALKERFGYIFEGKNGYPSIADALPLSDVIEIGPVIVRPFRQIHGLIDSIGYRFEHGGRALAYSTDLNAIPLASEPLLEGLDCWIVDALRRRPHPSHPHLARSLEWVARFAPRRAVLTHMDSSMDYDTLRSELPAHVEPGYDGMVIEL